jgi:hypothetical protein
MSEPDKLPDGTIGSQHLGVRVFSVSAPSMQELIDRIAVILGEHLDTGDELHVSFSSMQNGSQQHAGHKLLQTPRPWTELFFEYSALLEMLAETRRTSKRLSRTRRRGRRADA